MADTLLELLQTTAALFAAAFLLGIVFDRTKPGRRRDGFTGVVCGLFAAFLLLVPSTTLYGYQLAAAAPILLVAGLFGGAVSAAVAVALSLGAAVMTTVTAPITTVSAFVLMGILGVAARFMAERWSIWPHRPSVALATFLSPLALVALVVPGTLAGETPTLTITLAMAGWIPLATLIFGLMVGNEYARSMAAAREEAERSFERNTGHVSQVFFENQLSHHYHLSTRYGVAFSYLLVSVDDGLNRRDEHGATATDAVTEELACAIRTSVRDSDVCAMVAPDRFAVLLPHTTLGNVAPVVERIQRLARGNVAWPDGEPATVSIGAADSVDIAAPGDVEASAEGALFTANARQPVDAVGPANIMPQDGVLRSFPAQLQETPPVNAPLMVVQDSPRAAPQDTAA